MQEYTLCMAPFIFYIFILGFPFCIGWLIEAHYIPCISHACDLKYEISYYFGLTFISLALFTWGFILGTCIKENYSLEEKED